jgi:hypothetical protein
MRGLCAGGEGVGVGEAVGSGVGEGDTPGDGGNDGIGLGDTVGVGVGRGFGGCAHDTAGPSTMTNAAAARFIAVTRLRP